VDDEKKNGMKHSYSVAIEQAGGIALQLPYSENEEALEDYVARLDGFVFTGGADIDPKHFGEEKKDVCGRIYPFRDAFELRIFKKILVSKKPILAICRGMQLINVALGGTLYQDIPTEYKTSLCHAQTAPVTAPTHDILIRDNTPLAALLGKMRMMGNSFHHQAIKKLGKDLCITATAEDGTVEAVTYTGGSYLRGYQWHPERLCAFDSDNRILFEEFIKECMP
jgi:putative glutamine amidotransferase